MKGQIWSFDMIVSSVIFFSAVFLLLFAWNFTSTHSMEQIELRDIESKALTVSDSLIRTPGLPADWNNSAVAVIGLSSKENILNQTKVDRFVSLEYSTSRPLLSSPYHFYFELKHLNDTIVQSGGSNLTAGVQPINADLVVPVKRYVLYNEKLVKMRLILWR